MLYELRSALNVKIQIVFVSCELMAQLVRASLPGLCRAEHPGFESYSEHLLFIRLSTLFCIGSLPYFDWLLFYARVNEVVWNYLEKMDTF